MEKVGSYLYISGKDAIRAQQMFDLEDYTLCGRLCEQSVEKSLKAFIEIRGEESDTNLLKLHKPKRLYDRCCVLGLAEFDKNVSNSLAVFADYYFDTNYPGDAYFELTKEQAEEALSIMADINSLVRNKLSSGKMDLF